MVIFAVSAGVSIVYSDFVHSLAAGFVPNNTFVETPVESSKLTNVEVGIDAL